VEQSTPTAAELSDTLAARGTQWWGQVVGIPGLVNVSKKLWNITMFNGKTHYEWPFSIANC